MTKGAQIQFKEEWLRAVPPIGEADWGELWNETVTYYRQTFPATAFDQNTTYLVRRLMKLDEDISGQPIYGFVEYTVLGSQIVAPGLEAQPKATPENIKFLRAYYNLVP